MATFILINNVLTADGVKHLASSTIDDTVTDAAAITAAGGLLWPTGNATIDAAAVKAQAAHINAGANEAQLESTMQTAVQAVQKATDVAATTTTAGLESAADKTKLNLLTLIANGAKHSKGADAAAGTATAETPFYTALVAQTISAVNVNANAALTADGTNNATVIIRKRDGAGGAAATVATLVTDVAGGSWSAFVNKSLGAITNGVMAAGSVLTFEITKAGTGVVVPASTFTVTSTLS